MSPRPRRSRGKGEPAEAVAETTAKDSPAAEPGAPDPKPEEAAAGGGEPEAAKEEAEEKPRGGRRPRRAAEAAPSSRPSPPPRAPDGSIAVRARARYVRSAPRKARLVIDHIRGKPVGEARAILAHTPRAAARDVLSLLDSCVANAENNHELVADELVVKQAYVDEGPTLRRYRPRALGRATRIRKRTSHMTIVLAPVAADGDSPGPGRSGRRRRAKGGAS